MIYISFMFNRPVEALIFLLLAGINGLWAYMRFKKNLTVSFMPVIMLNFMALAAWAILLGVTPDEAEHLHLSWLVTHGMVPYKDFWQHHSPLLWVVIAPLVKGLDPSITILDSARIFCGALFAVNFFLGWRIARKVWGSSARFIVYLLVISSVSLSAEFLLLRPDIFMLFFLLLGVSISLDIPGKRAFPCFFVGLAFALAAAFMVKQYFIVILPIFAVFFAPKQGRLLKLLFYFLGLLAGIFPLFFYLSYHHILKDYCYWVFDFNSQRLVLSTHLYMPVLLVGGWGAWLLFKRFRQAGEPGAFILLLAFCLSTASSLTMTSTLDGGYYISFWFFICAIMASGCDLVKVFEKIPSQKNRAIIFGLFSSFFLASTVTHLLACRNPAYGTDKKAVAQLMKYCANEECVAFLSAHPIFSRDAIRLYSGWQYSFVSEYASVKEDVLRVPIARQIMRVRPAVVVCHYQRRDFLLELFQKGLISAFDYRKLGVFLKENYTQQRIGKEDYYVRNDKL